MKKVASYEELSKLIFSNLKKNVITNMFMTKEVLETEITFGNLYYILFSNGLFIIRDRAEYFVLNYYINNIDSKETKEEIEEILKEKIKKKIVIEVVGKTESDEKYIKICQLLEECGLEKTIVRERFSKKEEIIEDNGINDNGINDSSINNNSKNKNIEIVDNVNNNIKKIRYCEKADIKEVKNILELYFDKFHGCIPTIAQIEEDIKNKKIIKAVVENSDDEEIAGILHVDYNNNSSEIRHLAVKDEHRNKNIGTSLISYFTLTIKTQKSTVWTGKENIIAQKVYEKNGYKKDGYVSTVFEN